MARGQSLDAYTVVKTIHIVSATLLFGTGLGTAFFFLAAHVWGDRYARHFAARTTVRADFLFTLPAVIIQPVSGVYLIWQGDWGATASWLVAAYALYLLAGLCWVPVVFIQLRMARMLEAEAAGELLDRRRYRRLLRVWFVLGWPAFLGLIGIFWLMTAKPGW
jgi:uncharacterized membrane protein